MDKPKPNKLAQFYSGQIQPNGALSLRRSVQFWSGVDTAHLPPLLCKAPCFCALLFGELAMLDFKLCESRKAVLGPRTGTRASMELTAAHRESSGTLA